MPRRDHRAGGQRRHPQRRSPQTSHFAVAEGRGQTCRPSGETSPCGGMRRDSVGPDGRRWPSGTGRGPKRVSLAVSASVWVIGGRSSSRRGLVLGHGANPLAKVALHPQPASMGNCSPARPIARGPPAHRHEKTRRVAARSSVPCAGKAAISSRLRPRRRDRPSRYRRRVPRSRIPRRPLLRRPAPGSTCPRLAVRPLRSSGRRSS